MLWAQHRTQDICSDSGLTNANSKGLTVRELRKSVQEGIVNS